MKNLFLLIFTCFGFSSCNVSEINPPVLDEDYDYTTTADAEAASDTESNGSTDAADQEASSTEANLTQESTETTSSSESSQTYPDVAQANTTNMASGSDEAPEETSETQFDWGRVLITEVVTDPQQDHGESTAANGVKFDATPGTGSIGSTDEYIEIFNGTDTAVDVSLWTMNMIDGSDVSETLTDVNWESFFSAGGSVTAFEPGEFLVLGNPDGSINNTLTVELFDETGDVVDALTIDDANASSLEDEAYYLTPDGEWEQGAATPGFFPE